MIGEIVISAGGSMNAPGVSWNLHYQVNGEWLIMEGFYDAWDAWAFAVCNGMGDPLLGKVPDRFRAWTFRPPVEDTQLRLFQ